MQTLSNTTLYKKLNSVDPVDNEEAMTHLYKTLYWKFERYVLNNKGHKEDVKDIFQEALMVIYKKTKEKKISSDTKIEAYVFSTGRNLWLKQLQRRKYKSPNSPEDLNLADEHESTSSLFDVDKSEILNQLLEELGHGCQTILLSFYYEQQTMEDIVKNMNLSSVQIAKNKKYKCLQRLKKIVLNSEFYKNNLR